MNEHNDLKGVSTQIYGEEKWNVSERASNDVSNGICFDDGKTTAIIDDDDAMCERFHLNENEEEEE